MSLLTSVLNRLFPRGRSWPLTGQLGQVKEAIGEYLDTPYEFLKNVKNEAIPATATLTIDQWLEALGISAPPTSTLAQKRAIAQRAISAIGGQSLDYINEQIQVVFPLVYVDELIDPLTPTPYTNFYYVRGAIPFASYFSYLQAILQRIGPLHLEPVFETRTIYDADVARCNIGVVGRAICGRADTAYTETDAQVARCAVGRAGIAVTGRIPA